MASKKQGEKNRPRDLRALIDQTARAEVERIKTSGVLETARAGKPAKGAKSAPAAKKEGEKKTAPRDWRVQVPEVGSTVDVYFRIREGDKTRLQRYTGTVIRHKGKGISRSITVRRIVAGEGVERIFPIYSPKVDRIEIVKHGRTRRAKLYFLRDRVGKGTRLKEVIMTDKQAGADLTSSAH
jgi:large subunit ribosomal protein L19